MACIRISPSCIITVSDGEGSAVVSGRTWRWDFHDYLGPTFVDRHGNMLKRQPGENHPIWKPFAAWVKAYDARKAAKQATRRADQRDAEIMLELERTTSGCPACDVRQQRRETCG